MWLLEDIDISIDEVEQALMIVSVVTPDCTIQIIGTVSMIGRILHVKAAHVQGASAGALGRAGLQRDRAQTLGRS